MRLLIRTFFGVLICALALVVGRSIAHAVISSSASAPSYDSSVPLTGPRSTDNMTGTLALSDQDDQSITATSIVLSPRPTIVVTATMSIFTPTVAATETPTHTPTSTRAPTLTPMPAYVKYTVRRGDTLLKLAESFNTTRQSIIDMNPDVPNLDELREGEKLHIPAIVPKGKAPETIATSTSTTMLTSTVVLSPSVGDTVESTVTPVPTSDTTEVVTSPTVIPTVATGTYIEYTIKKGDTLLGIAKAYNTTGKAILNLNPDIVNPEQLKIGQVLRIPQGN